MSKPFRAYRIIRGHRHFAHLFSEDADIRWFLDRDGAASESLIPGEFRPVFERWPGGCEIVEEPEPAKEPKPDAIDAAIRGYRPGDYECSKNERRHLRAIADAILAEADRRAAARLEPLPLTEALAARAKAIGYANSDAGYRIEADKIRAKQEAAK